MNDDRFDDDEPADEFTLRRRTFLQTVAGAAAVSMFPLAAYAGEATPREQLMTELRRQLRAKSKLGPARVKRVVRRVKELLPKTPELAYGHVVIGVRLGSDGTAVGISTCTGGHSCAPTFETAPPDPSCTAQGTVCEAESCKTQSCSANWCGANACETESCSNNVCDVQSCEGEACSEQTCDSHEATDFSALMSKSSGWSKIQSEIISLRKAKDIKVTVAVQGTATAK